MSAALVALAGVAQFVGHRPLHQKVASFIPSQQHMPVFWAQSLFGGGGGGCVQDPADPCYSLTSMFSSSPSPTPSKNQ